MCARVAACRPTQSHWSHSRAIQAHPLPCCPHTSTSDTTAAVRVPEHPFCPSAAVSDSPSLKQLHLGLAEPGRRTTQSKGSNGSRVTCRGSRRTTVVSSCLPFSLHVNDRATSDNSPHVPARSNGQDSGECTHACACLLPFVSSAMPTSAPARVSVGGHSEHQLVCQWRSTLHAHSITANTINSDNHFTTG